MAYQVKRLQDGQTFEFDDPNAVEQLVKSGEGVLVGPARVYNPQDQQSYDFDDPAHATEVLKSGGGALEGSHAHQVSTTGKLESAARGLAQGGSFGFADELQAAVRAPFSDRSYSQIRDEYRQGDATAQEANPKTFGAGELGGSVATAFLPIPGTTLAKGATIGQEIGLGAKLGAASGLGHSQADLTEGNVLGALNDTKNSAMMGGAGAGALGALGRVATSTGRFLSKGAADAFDPGLQRLLASGARTKALSADVIDKGKRATEVMSKLGAYSKNADGSLPNAQEIFDKYELFQSQAADDMHALMSESSHLPPVNVIDEVVVPTIPKLRELIQHAPPGEGQAAADSLDEMLQRMDATQGNVAELWAIKKDLGSPNYVGRNGWELPPNRTGTEVSGYKLLNQHLAELLDNATEQIATQTGNLRLRDLNRQYGAATQLADMLAPELARNKWQASSMGLKFRDVVGGGMVGGMASALGAGGLSSVAGAAGGVLNAGLRSTQGRLVRAQIGEKIHLDQLRQGNLGGLLPRQLEPAKQWLQQNMMMVQQAMPQLLPSVQKIMTETPAAAEVEIRLLMPMIQQFMAPSQYKSEFEGKVTAPEDRIAASKRMSGFGMKASELAVRQSMLNRDGKLSPEAFAPDEYGQELIDYAGQLDKQGF